MPTWHINHKLRLYLLLSIMHYTVIKYHPNSECRTRIFRIRKFEQEIWDYFKFILSEDISLHSNQAYSDS